MKCKTLFSILFLAVLLVGAFVLSGCAMIEQVAVSDDMFFRYRADKGGYILLQYMGESDEVTVPDNIQGEPVVGIGAEAFRKNKTIKKLTIPNSVKYMYSHTLEGCDALTYLSIPFIGLKAGVEEDEWLGSIFGVPLQSQQYHNYLPQNLKTVVVTGGENYIPNKAFAFCGSIENIILGENISLIGEEAFYHCLALRSCSLPSTLAEIGDRAFYRCSALEEMTLPAGIDLIGEEAFSCCQELRKVDFLCADAFVCGLTFSSCDSLTEVNLADGIPAIASEMFFACTSLKNIKIPASVTRIYPGAFAYCWELEKVELPEGIVSIDRGAFRNCTAIHEVVLPSTVTEIDFYSWADCNAIKKVYCIGTEEEWASRKEMLAIDAFKYATFVYCSADEVPGAGNEI